LERERGTRDLEERYEGYTIYDNTGEKIGKVDELVDETDREEYLGVKMGLFGLSGTALIPMELARVSEREKIIEVSADKDEVKDAPSYSHDEEVTPEFEDRIRRHFGLEPVGPSPERGFYGPYEGTAADGAVAGGAATPRSAGMEGLETDEQRHRMS
jgi:hypothetical protein